MTLVQSAQQTPSRRTVPLGLAGGAYANLSGTVNAQTCINWYVVPAGPEAATKAALYPTPGTTLVRSVGAGPHRGSIEHKGKTYFVSGSELIEMDSGENFSTISGVLATAGGRVDMCSNGDFGDQILIVDGSAGYVFNGTTLAVIADADFPANPTACEYLDGRAVVTVANSGVWYISDLNDFTAWTATQFANAERDRDNLVCPFVNNRDLILFGEFTTEVATNTGASPFPFEVYSNGLFDVGIAARFSAASAKDKVMWLSQDRRGNKQIQISSGTSYKPLSTPAIDYQISTYSTVSDAHAFTYSEYGMDFYQITFPSAGVTWVCNLSVYEIEPEYAWFQKKTGTTRHIASTYVYYNNKHYVGAWNSSNLYAMSSAARSDDGTEIIRERTAGRLVSDSNKRMRHYSLDLVFEAGTGLVSGQGSDPQVAIDWSDNDGKTWSNVRTLDLGGIGRYDQRTKLDHLGMDKRRGRIYRIRASDPVKLVGLEGYVDVEEMLH